jgi:hypothetical protein
LIVDVVVGLTGRAVLIWGWSEIDGVFEARWNGVGMKVIVFRLYVWSGYSGALYSALFITRIIC